MKSERRRRRGRRDPHGCVPLRSRQRDGRQGACGARHAAVRCRLRVGGDHRLRLRTCVNATPLLGTQLVRHSSPSTVTTAVIDLHEEWCGPCTALEATYRRLALDLPQGSLRVYSASRPKLSDEQRATLPGGGGAGCRPLILVFKARTAVPQRPQSDLRQGVAPARARTTHSVRAPSPNHSCAGRGTDWQGRRRERARARVPRARQCAVNTGAVIVRHCGCVALVHARAWWVSRNPSPLSNLGQTCKRRHAST